MNKTYYLHTIKGQAAAYYPGDQICYLTHFGTAGPLATSLRQIRKEQKASVEFRQKMGCAEDGSEYGYRRVSTPWPPKS